MRLGTLVAMTTKVYWDLERINDVRKFVSQLYAFYLMRFNGMPKQNVISTFHVIHLSHNNSNKPVITDMNQSLLI